MRRSWHIVHRRHFARPRNPCFSACHKWSLGIYPVFGYQVCFYTLYRSPVVIRLDGFVTDRGLEIYRRGKKTGRISRVTCHASAIGIEIDRSIDRIFIQYGKLVLILTNMNTVVTRKQAIMDSNTIICQVRGKLSAKHLNTGTNAMARRAAIHIGAMESVDYPSRKIKWKRIRWNRCR